MYKISPTQLEAFRVFKLDLYDKTLEEYLNEIRGVKIKKFALSFGSTVHKYLNEPDTVKVLEKGNPAWMDDKLYISEAEQLEDIGRSIPNLVSEVFTYKDFGNIRSYMVVDRLIGTKIVEIKTTGYFKGVEAYSDSLQWKLYLLGTEASEIEYHIISYLEKRPTTFTHKAKFSFYPYKEMEKEVLDYFQEFIEFCKFHKVDNFITMK